MQLYHGFIRHTITGLGYNKKLGKRFDAKVEAKDYWEACGKRFDHLQDIGVAMKEAKLKVPESGKVWVRKMGSRCNEVPGMKFTAWILGVGALAGIGISIAAAFKAVTSTLLIILPLVGGMICGSIAVGLVKAAKAFEIAPQIREQGQVSLDKSQKKVSLVYTYVHGKPRRVINL